MTLIREDLMIEFSYFASIVVLKLLAMTLITARWRWQNGTFMNLEDCIYINPTFHYKGQIKLDDEDVERTRNSHRNDLENVLPWFVATYVWLTTGPSLLQAMILIRAYTLIRTAYTIVYCFIPIQPYRFLLFFGGYFITAYQALATIAYYST